MRLSAALLWLVATTSLSLAAPTHAQLIPDNTLGSEASQVIRSQPGDAEIDGGARRGSNLFHSFREFNVEEGGSVYFRDPTGIENILTRVTGRNASSILGTLGVRGDANLYLINPNGIVFGPNAMLDIDGSFTASTADRFLFGDGQAFGTLNPQMPPLLTMDVPIGLQYNAGWGRAGRITNQGNLTVGEDLTLDAGLLNLSGRLWAGNDLTLRAQNNLFTDGVFRAGQDVSLEGIFLNLSGPFQAGNDLTMAAQGNLLSDGELWAGQDMRLRAGGLLQLESGARSGGNMRLQGDGAINVFGEFFGSVPRLRSGGDLRLLSDGVVTTDAELSSAGGFAVRRLTGEPGYWVNGQMTTLNVPGDYRVGDYRGPSLQVNAAGDIRYGRVVIDDPDAANNSELPMFTLNAGGRILGTGSIFSTQPGLLVSLVSQENLRVQGITTRGGPISLVSRRGNITSRDRLSTGSIVDEDFNVLEEYEGGAIALSASRDINVVGSDSSSFSVSRSGQSGNGGNMILSAGRNLNAEGSRLRSGSSSISGSGRNGNGGNIILSAGRNLNASVSRPISGSGRNGNGGNIILSAGRNLNATNSSFFSGSGRSGNGGNIILSAGRDLSAAVSSLGSGSFEVSGRSGNGGNMILAAGKSLNAVNLVSASRSISFRGRSGNGGNMILSAGMHLNAADLTTELFSISGSGQSGNGGNMILSAGRDLNAAGSNTELFSSPDSGRGGNGGNMILSAGRDLSAADSRSELFSLSSSGQGRNGGNMILSAGRDLSAAELFLVSVSFSSLGRSGNGGNIILSAGRDLNATGSSLRSVSFSSSGWSGNGGNIVLFTGRDLNAANSELNSFSYAEAASSGNGGAISLIAPRGGMNGEGGRTILNSFSVGQRGNEGQGGNVRLLAQGHIANIEILTLASSSRSGRVEVQGSNDLSIRDVRILTSQEVQIPDPLNPEERITVSFGASGQAGEVEIRSTGRLSLINSRIESNTRSRNPAGNISLSSPDRITLRNSRITSDTNAQGAAGNITLMAPEIFMDDSEVVAGSDSLEQGGIGGNVTLQNLDLLLLENGSQISARAFGDADSGTLTISAPNGYIIGLPFENNDIIATAEGGTGGNISIEANRIFGFVDQTNTTLTLDELRNNSTNDISVSSEVGAAGVVELTTLNTDPSQGLAALPGEIVDAATQIGQVCPTGPGASARLGRFVITGRGGIAPSPLGLQEDLGFSVDWMRDEAAGVSPSGEVMEDNSSQSDQPFVEADGWQVGANGQMQLVASATPYRQGRTGFVCP